MFCPFIQNECRTDCVFRTKKASPSEHQCAILMASLNLDSIDSRIGTIENSLDDIERTIEK